MSKASIVREWTRPDGSKCVGGSEDNAKAPPGSLMLYNSLLDEKVPFVPASGPGSKSLSWYTCGPTVYDVSHMGHARNYVTFDIIRRVLEDYFGYNILYVMNVTDVDDKIILRARRNYLLAKYKEGKHTDAEVKAFIEKAVQNSFAKQSVELAEAGASVVKAFAEKAVQNSFAKQSAKLAEAKALVVKAFAEKAVQNSFAKQSAKLAEAEALVVAAKEEQEAAAADKKGGLQRQLNELEGAIKNEAHKLSQIQTALSALGQAGDSATIYAVASDFVAEELDREQGKSVTDSSIFRAHAAKYEAEFTQDMDSLGVRRPDAEFTQDMDSLGVRRPDVLTRVSEYMDEIVDYVKYMDEIVDYVKKIVDNGMAYESNGSVYFDTTNFRACGHNYGKLRPRACGHTYGKLKPWAVGSSALAAEGESNFETSEKRSNTDFALWKASKPGEPFWESPWGQGRPGWHIECSAMASTLIGSRMDIHTGGDDLRFPHHDNELAQAEAFYHNEGCHQWVNYFLHSGHLEIEGLKMSKSLKNFITIREALKSFSARQLRLLFVLQPWNKSIVGEGPVSKAAGSTESGGMRHLSDNLNTAAVMDTLSNLIKSSNICLSKKREAT
eukprot:gene18385-biopygen27313